MYSVLIMENTIPLVFFFFFFTLSFWQTCHQVYIVAVNLTFALSGHTMTLIIPNVLIHLPPIISPILDCLYPIYRQTLMGRSSGSSGHNAKPNRVEVAILRRAPTRPRNLRAILSPRHLPPTISTSLNPHIPANSSSPTLIQTDWP